MSHDGEGPSTEDAGADAPGTEDGSDASETRLMIVDASDLDSVPFADAPPAENDDGADSKTGAGAEANETSGDGSTGPDSKTDGPAESGSGTADPGTKNEAKNDADASKTDDAKTGEAKTGETKTGEAKTGETKAGETKTGDAKDSDSDGSEEKPDDKPEAAAATSTETKTGDAKTDAAESGAAKSGESKTGESKSGESKSGESKNGESKSGDTKIDEAKTGAKSDNGKAGTKDKPITDPSTTGTMPVVKAGKTRSGMGRGPKIALAVVGGFIGAYLILTAAWAFDLARHNDAAMRGISFADRPVGGMVESEMEAVVDELTDELGAQPLTISVGDVDVETDPVSVGVRIDDGRMIDQALRARRDGSLFLRPFRWLGHLVTEQVIDPIYVVDAEAANDASEQVIRSELAQPVEPEFDVRGAELVVIPGQEGVRIEPRELVGRLPVTIADGAPFRLELAEEPSVPVLDTVDLETVAAEVNSQTEQPVNVQVLDDQVQVSPRMMKTWIRLDLGADGENADVENPDDENDDADAGDADTGEVADTEDAEPPTVDWRLDEEAVLADLKPLFPTLGSEDQQARFSVVDDEPIIIPAAETVICCDEGAGDLLEQAIRQPIPVAETDEEEEAASEDEEPTLRVARLSPIVTDFDEGVAELEDLGIVELVSTFETKHACCANRVKNIQRFADLMQGVIIRPDETFSLNEHVGQRTRDKGFFADGAIAQGVIEPQVGGGISQYATTFFNASFFAGLEFVEYQSHSIYISRYPRGREATISWRRPDLKVKNNTPYGILVWNEYTPTSIKVSFYSTEHLDVQALDLRRSSDRQCRIDITPRVITYPDGTQIEDSVFALYRPGEGFDCNGNSTRPEEDDDE